jgi:glycosyltransferase involved in cell wall biosynthesis
VGGSEEATNDPAAGPVRLGLLAVTPVYYQAPLYRRLAADPRLDFTAVFASDEGVVPGEFGYGKPIAWDQNAVDGYEHVFLRNARRNQALSSSTGLRDFDVVPLLVRRRFEVLWLHGYNYVTHVLAAVTQRALGGRVIVREEQTLIHPRPLVRTLAKEVLLRALLHNVYAMYLGTESRRWFEHYGVPADRLSFAPYAVDNDSFATETSTRAPDRAGLLAGFGLDPDKPVVLTVSRLVASKQTSVVLDAFARVRARMPCSLLIVGAGPMEGELRRAVASAQIPDVAFAGFVGRERIYDAYACADAFVLFSERDETWGLVVNEAAATGLPTIVSSNCGAACDLVRDGYSGFVVDPRDPAMLERRIAELLADPGMRQRFGEQARRVLEPFSYDTAAAGVVRAVEMAVGGVRWALASSASEPPHGSGGRTATAIS